MRVLWITNTLFPDVCKQIGIDIPVVGGWMFSSANALLNTNPNIILAVAAVYKGEYLQTMELNGITYFLIPSYESNKKYISNLEINWKEIEDQFLPDVVHIHGTEYSHGLAFINSSGNRNIVVSIQGLVSVYERYYYGGIKKSDLIKYTTLRDLIRLDTVFNQRHNMQSRGHLEKLMLQSVQHIIGRTSWDKCHSWAINANAKYHFCNETLRSEFYDHSWDITKCNRHSIFLSQAHYPIKGLQQIIKALPIILKYYPDTKVYVAGNNFITNRGWRINGFGSYILSTLIKNNIFDKVFFTGPLSVDEMCNQYLSSHVFVCPSSIENSPNSIGEAQLLGVPCVSAYVGGVSDMISNEETGLLYRHEEIEMLAEAVCRIFSNDDLAIKISRNSRIIAAKRHNKLINSKSLVSIYELICKIQ